MHVRTDTDSLHQTETERRTIHDDDSHIDNLDGAEDEEKEESRSSSQFSTFQEVREGIPNEQDVEAKPEALEKKASRKSLKDPNLVGHAIGHSCCERC